MTQFSNVTYSGVAAGSGTGTDPISGDSISVQITGGQITATLTEAANGTITGTFSYDATYVVTDESNGGQLSQEMSGGGTVSGTEGNLHFVDTSGGAVTGGSGSLSNNDTTLSFSGQ